MNRTIIVLPAFMLLLLTSCGPKGVAGRRVITGTEGNEEDPIEALNKEVDTALASGEEVEEGGTTTAGTSGTGGTGAAGTGTAKGTGTGPGQLLISCKCMGEDVNCDVSVLKTEDLGKVDGSKDKTKHSFAILPGTYRLELFFHQAVDDPRLTLQGVTIGPGETVERVVNFPMAQVKFVPVGSTGKGKIAGWKLRIKLKGADNWANDNVKLNEYVFMSPGLYEGQLYKGGKNKEITIDITSIQINEGAKSQVPIYVTH